MAATKDAATAIDLGRNIKGVVNGNTLILEIDLTKDLGKSKSQKNTIIASTGGNIGIVTGAGTVKLGLNLYK